MENILEFKTRESAENSEIFKEKKFARFLKDMRDNIENPFKLELIDFGTHLSHQDILKYGNLIKW